MSRGILSVQRVPRHVESNKIKMGRYWKGLGCDYRRERQLLNRFLHCLVSMHRSIDGVFATAFCMLMD